MWARRLILPGAGWWSAHLLGCQSAARPLYAMIRSLRTTRASSSSLARYCGAEDFTASIGERSFEIVTYSDLDSDTDSISAPVGENAFQTYEDYVDTHPEYGDTTLDSRLIYRDGHWEWWYYHGSDIGDNQWHCHMSFSVEPYPPYPTVYLGKWFLQKDGQDEVPGLPGTRHKLLPGERHDWSPQ